MPAERATARLSAYVYGNILALASIAVATSASINNGSAVALVAGTGATTFIAHIFADVVAHASVSGATGADSAADKLHVRAELRDAVPIASSAAIPALVLVLGWLGVLSSAWAHLLAGGVVVVRIAGLPIVAERIRGNSLSFRVLVAGLLTAGLAAAIVVVKVAVGH